MANTIEFTNVSNEESFGVEWTAGDHRNQLRNPRGTTELWVLAFVNGKWVGAPVVNPARYGLASELKWFAGFAEVAGFYVNGLTK
jgi:hypothetical protein